MKDNHPNTVRRFVEFYSRQGLGLWGATGILKCRNLTKEVIEQHRILPENEIPVLWMSSEYHSYEDKREIIEKTTEVDYAQILAYRFYHTNNTQPEEQGNLSRIYVLGRIINVEAIPERKNLPTREETINYFGNEKGLKKIICTRTKSIETLEDLDNTFGKGKWAPVPKSTFQYFDFTKYKPKIKTEIKNRRSTNF